MRIRAGLRRALYNNKPRTDPNSNFAPVGARWPRQYRDEEESRWLSQGHLDLRSVASLHSRPCHEIMTSSTVGRFANFELAQFDAFFDDFQPIWCSEPDLTLGIKDILKTCVVRDRKTWKSISKRAKTTDFQFIELEDYHEKAAKWGGRRRLGRACRK